MPKNKDDRDSTRAQVKKRLGIPLDYVPMTSEEFVLQQEFIRDTAMTMVVEILTAPKFVARGLLALQELGLRAQAAIIEEHKVTAQIGTEDISDKTTIGYECTLPVPKAEIEA